MPIKKQTKNFSFTEEFLLDTYFIVFAWHVMLQSYMILWT